MRGAADHWSLGWGWERTAALEGPRIRKGSPLRSHLPSALELAGYCWAGSDCGEQWGFSLLSEPRGEMMREASFGETAQPSCTGRGAAALHGLWVPGARELRSAIREVREPPVADEELDLIVFFLPRLRPARPRNCRGGRSQGCGSGRRDHGAVARVAGWGVPGAGGRIPSE